jgi:hypothetical protein
VIPETAGLLDGIVVRVPLPTGSLVDPAEAAAEAESRLRADPAGLRSRYPTVGWEAIASMPRPTVALRGLMPTAQLVAIAARLSVRGGIPSGDRRNADRVIPAHLRTPMPREAARRTSAATSRPGARRTGGARRPCPCPEAPRSAGRSVATRARPAPGRPRSAADPPIR